MCVERTERPRKYGLRCPVGAQEAGACGSQLRPFPNVMCPTQSTGSYQLPRGQRPRFDFIAQHSRFGRVRNQSNALTGAPITQMFRAWRRDSLTCNPSGPAIFTVNQNKAERVLRLVVAAAILPAPLVMGATAYPLALAAFGAVLLFNALSGACLTYQALGVTTCSIPQPD